MPVTVHVVGGFLGAGKTSAIRHLLAGPLQGRKVAVVVNDFGESALDEVLLGDGGHTLAEIRGECVCCTAPEGFVGAVGSLLEDPDLDAIVVEPTGLARPADLVDTLRRAPFADEIHLGPLVVLADPAVLEAREDLRRQAALADVLVANRVDLATPEQLAAYEAWADALWPAPILRVRTTHGALGAEVLEWGEHAPRVSSVARSHGHAHHHQNAHSATWPPDRVFHRARLRAVLERCATTPEFLRAKGLVRTNEGWCRVDVAGGTVHEAPTEWRRDSRIDLISDGALAPLADALDGALLTAEERAVAADSLEVALPDGSARRFDREALLALPDGVPDVSAVFPKRAGVAARLSELVRVAGVPEGSQVVVVAADGYTTPPAPLADVLAGLLIHSLDEGPLPRDKGGPIRLMVPEDAGPGGPCANVKGVVRLSFRID